MRTRLDEIVEEGMVGLDTMFDTKTGAERLLALQRIAERAYNEGLEDAAKWADSIPPQGGLLGDQIRRLKHEPR